MAAMKILIVDDEPAVRAALKRALTMGGYSVVEAADGAEAVLAADREDPDAVVLDVLMPGVNGLDACRQLRRGGNHVPILMLTARETVSDRVAGLDAGADDYLIKPFALQELLARLRALLRRTVGTGGVYKYRDLVLDTGSYQVTRNGRVIELTRTEFSLLEMLLRNAEKVMSRSRILEEVWGFDFETNTNSLDVYIGYLRRKTEGENETRLIQTVRGIGYVLRDETPVK